MSVESFRHSRSFSWFTVVGALAGIVHYVVAVGLEAGISLHPGWANVCGFLCAFPVSYMGHRKFSFARINTTHQQALPRFLLVACGGFLENQFLLLSGLKLLAWPFWIILGIVMVLVAATTYTLSRFWAFKPL
jgi:putative flippase GtrA